VIKDQYLLNNGCEILGSGCELQISSKGIVAFGEFFQWDAAGLQASRKNKNEYMRINIRGKVGEVILFDLITERPKGKTIGLIRMTVAEKKKS